MAVSLRRGTPVGRRSPPGMQLVVYCSAVFVGVYATVPYAVRYLHLDNSGVSASLVSVPLTPTWGDNQTVAELWSSQGCEAIFESERPVHTQDTWMLLRRAYEKAVEGPTRSVVYMSPISTVNGFGVPIEARQAVGKGRGVYAAGRGATKGELVWAARYQSARFGDGASYRRFLGLLAVDVACDVLQWVSTRIPLPMHRVSPRHWRVYIGGLFVSWGMPERKQNHLPRVALCSWPRAPPSMAKLYSVA